MKRIITAMALLWLAAPLPARQAAGENGTLAAQQSSRMNVWQDTGQEDQLYALSEPREYARQEALLDGQLPTHQYVRAEERLDTLPDISIAAGKDNFQDDQYTASTRIRQYTFYGSGHDDRQDVRPLMMTLEDCLEYAMGNNYNREITVLSEESAGVTYNQSKMERLPSLSASVGENLSHTTGDSPNWTGNYGVNTGITVWQGGLLNNTIEQNKLIAEQAGYEVDRYDNDLTVQIMSSFLSALGNQELLSYQQSVLQASEEQRKQGEELYRVGSILQSDYLMLEAQYASDLNNIIETRISRDNSLLQLKTLMSMDPLQPLEIIYPDTTTINRMTRLPSEQFVLERAMETLPDLEISRYNVEIAESGLKIARSSLFPTVGLSGSIGSGHGPNFQNYGTQLNDRFNQQVGVSVSIPIYNRGATKARITQSKINLRQAELSQMQTDITVRQTVIQEYQNVVGALSSFNSSSIREEAYRKTYEVYRAQFNVGQITAVDLLQQQNNYISALNEYIRAKYGFILQRKVLDVYMGIKIEM